jgi:hypothetical protein
MKSDVLHPNDHYDDAKGICLGLAATPPLLNDGVGGAGGAELGVQDRREVGSEERFIDGWDGARC